jgi:hypothetical protein
MESDQNLQKKEEIKNLESDIQVNHNNSVLRKRNQL